MGGSLLREPRLEAVDARLENGDGALESPQPPIELGVGEPNHRSNFLELTVHLCFQMVHPSVEAIDALAVSEYSFRHELDLSSSPSTTTSK